MVRWYASVEETADFMHIPRDVIRAWIAEGRLEQHYGHPCATGVLIRDVRRVDRQIRAEAARTGPYTPKPPVVCTPEACALNWVPYVLL
jgi:hypothetical protein